MSGTRSSVLTRVAYALLFVAVAAVLGTAVVPDRYADVAVEYVPYAAVGLLALAATLGVLSIRRMPRHPAGPPIESPILAVTAALPVVPEQRAEAPAYVGELPAPTRGHLPIGMAGNAGPALPAGPAGNQRRLPLPRRPRAALPAGPVTR